MEILRGGPGPIGRKDGRWSVGNVGLRSNENDPWVQGITAPSGKHYVLVRTSDGGITVYSHGIGCYFHSDGTLDLTRNSRPETVPLPEDIPEYVTVWQHHTLPASNRGIEA